MGKYDKYFVTQTKPDVLHETYLKGLDGPTVDHRIAIDSEGDGLLPGAFHLEPHIVVRANAGGAEGENWRPHCHDFDEYLLFFSIDPDNVVDLGGEIELWMEDERHLITETTAVFIPRYLYHLPLVIRKVDRPFAWVATANTLKYSHIQYSNDDRFADDFILDQIAEVDFGDKKYQVTRSHLEYVEFMMERGRKKLLS